MIGSSCPMDADPVELYTPVVRKARKPHLCYECSQVIAPGTTYTYVSYKAEGEFFNHKFCGTCWELSQFAVRIGIEVVFGELWEALHACGRDLIARRFALFNYDRAYAHRQLVQRGKLSEEAADVLLNRVYKLAFREEGDRDGKDNDRVG